MPIPRDCPMQCTLLHAMNNTSCCVKPATPRWRGIAGPAVGEAGRATCSAWFSSRRPSKDGIALHMARFPVSNREMIGCWTRCCECAMHGSVHPSGQGIFAGACQHFRAAAVGESQAVNPQPAPHGSCRCCGNTHFEHIARACAVPRPVFLPVRTACGAAGTPAEPRTAPLRCSPAACAQPNTPLTWMTEMRGCGLRESVPSPRTSAWLELGTGESNSFPPGWPRNIETGARPENLSGGAGDIMRLPQCQA